MTKQTRDIEQIADYIYAHPDKKNSEIVSHFVKEWRKSDRTIHRYIKKAEAIVNNRLEVEKEAKQRTIAKEAEKSVMKSILTRQKALEILSDIARGNARKIEGQLFVPADRERVAAIKEIAEFESWKSPQEIRNMVQIEEPLTWEERQKIKDELEKDY